jgi:hypothetical protein
MNVRSIPTLAVLIAILALPGCSTERNHGALGTVVPRLDETAVPACNRGASRDTLPFAPANFVAGVDNPFFPLTPGTVLTYTDGTEITRTEVTHEAKNILGIAATVVHDRVTVDGALTEDTFDWYAQDRTGNVWYLGEDTKELENGVVVSTEGSWEAGVNGARAGIIMLTHPRVGDAYAQEIAPGVAEDKVKVVALDRTVTVRYGPFTGCLKTSETTPLDPGAHEYKYYARGVGVVLEVTPSGGRTRLELTGVSRP